jgi:hypothetical protein
VVDEPAGATGLGVDHVPNLVVGAGVGVGAAADWRRRRVSGNLAQKATSHGLLERREAFVLVHPGHPAKIIEAGGTTQDRRGREEHRSVGAQAR